MTPDTLSALAGAILSVVLNYFPGLNTTFDRLTANQQRLAMGVLLAVSAVGLALWTCSDPAQGGFGVCLGETNWRAVVQSFVFALMANQATDRISPKKQENRDQGRIPPPWRPSGSETIAEKLSRESSELHRIEGEEQKRAEARVRAKATRSNIPSSPLGPSRKPPAG